MRPRWQPRLPGSGLSAETCARKRRYETWDEARLAGMAVWRENPRPTDANPPTPYPCNAIAGSHYHCGHIRLGRKPGQVPA